MVKYGPISNLKPLKDSVSEISLPNRSSIVVSPLGLNRIISPGKSSILLPFSSNFCFFKSQHTNIVFVFEVLLFEKEEAYIHSDDDGDVPLL